MVLKEYVLKLVKEYEALVGCPVDVVEDEDCKFPCKMEYAHSYARDHHVVRFNPSKCINCFPIFQTVLHSRLLLRKLEDGSYGTLQPGSTQEQCNRFDKEAKADPVGRQLLRRFGPAQFDGCIGNLRVGMITQAASQVMEMLVSDVVLRDYPEAVEDMKATLRVLAVEGAAAPKEQLLEVFPAFIVETNRALNIAYAMKCGEICGEKLVDAYHPTDEDIDRGLDLYNFYKTERDALLKSGKIAGDVVFKIFEYLKVDRFAQMRVVEIAPLEFHASEDDGFTPEQRAQLEKFKKSWSDNKEGMELMALAMYKVIRELSTWTLDATKALAVEIALLGATGIAPGKSYELKAFPNRGGIRGLEVLAYYYVSWAKVFPDKLEMLGLPYKPAYDAANRMIELLRGK